MTEIFGALVAVAAAALYDTGYILEKQALDGLPPLRLTPAGMVRTARASRRWTVGFVALMGGLALQVVALTLAPVSVVQPILAGGLIALAAAGSALTGEALDRRHRAVLGLVLLAVGAIAMSARSGPLARAVPAGAFSVVGTAVAGGAGAMLIAGRGRRRSSPGLATSAVVAGALYGFGALAEKAVATNLVREGFLAGARHSLATGYPWVFAAATLAGMVVFQGGLQAYPVSLMASLTNGVSTVAALAGAAFVFSESPLPGGWYDALRLAGLAAIAGAVVVLAIEPRTAPAVSGEPAAAGPGGA